MKSWMVGDQKSFSHYTAPAKEKGTKMLKVGKNLWTWSPSTERIIHIAGHLLRQSVMGSDLSYEDALEEVKLSEAYTSTIMKEETVRERKVWLLQLTAKIPDLAYVERRLWVDQEWFVPMREELYGKSGRLLKTINIMETKFLDNRWYPVKILFKDELKSGNGTEFITDVVDFNPDIPENLFSKQSLRK
jgi:outer membrane lipoprotein-sorting protein